MTNAMILIVEDESVSAAMIEHQLHKLGYAIAGIASSGEEAVRLARQVKPDLVLMDIELDGVMDGVEAASLIRNTSQVPIIYLTANTEERTIIRAGLTEAHGYLTKPIQDRELHSMVQVALNKSWTESRIREEQQWLAATLRLVSDAVIAADASGAVKFINPAAELLTGWCEKEALNRDLSEIVRELEPDTREPTEFVLMRVIRDHRSTNISRRLLITRDGSEITVEEMATPIMNEKGYLTGVVMVLRCPSTVAGTEGKTEMSATNSAAIARS